MSWYVAPALDTLRDEINRAHPGRDRSSDGAIGDPAHQARKSDHNPDWSAGGVVRARDFDRDGIDVAGIFAVLERDQRTRYLIFDGRIWTRDTGRWLPYAGINPHEGHFHISVRIGHEHDTSPWGIGAGEDEDTMYANDKGLQDRLAQIVDWMDHRFDQLTAQAEANRNMLAGFTRDVVKSAVTQLPDVDPAAVERAVTKAVSDAFDSIERETTTTTVNIRE